MANSIRDSVWDNKPKSISGEPIFSDKAHIFRTTFVYIHTKKSWFDIQFDIPLVIQYLT